MRTGMTIHDIAKVEIDKKPSKLAHPQSGANTHTKHITITDEQGFELEITLFSDNVETLKVKGI